MEEAEAISKKSYVYVVGAIGGAQPWKIGRTTDPKQRMASLQAHSPVKLEYIKIAEAHPTLEPSIHRQFARYRIHGEWFSFPEEDQQKVLARLDGDPWVYKVLKKASTKKPPLTKTQTMNQWGRKTKWKVSKDTRTAQRPQKNGIGTIAVRGCADCSTLGHCSKHRPKS